MTDTKQALRECAAAGERARTMVCEARGAVASAEERVARARARLAALRLLRSP